VMIQILGDFNSDAEKDILRNLEILYATAQGEVALDRSFGLDQSFLDMSGPAAEAMYTQEIVNKTRTYEPRADVVSVTYRSAAPGELNPEVKIKCLI